MKQSKQSEIDELFQRWRAGDAMAYDTLFLRLYPFFCYYASQFGLSSEEAEEVVQDCFYRLWQSQNALSDIQNIKAYLYTSVRNVSINQRKMQQRRLHRNHRYYEALPRDAAPVDFALMESELLMHLREAIRSLPEQCSKVMQLSYEQGFSGKEIAELLGVTVSTVNNQKARGVKLLRQRFLWRQLDMGLSLLLLYSKFL